MNNVVKFERPEPREPTPAERLADAKSILKMLPYRSSFAAGMDVFFAPLRPLFAELEGVAETHLHARDAADRIAFEKRMNQLAEMADLERKRAQAMKDMRRYHLLAALGLLAEACLDVSVGQYSNGGDWLEAMESAIKEWEKSPPVFN